MVGFALLPRTPASAQAYPKKPIQIIVPFPAGGPTDVIARRVADKLQQSLGKPIIVDNRPGGATMIGANAVIKSEPDGHTLLCGTTSTFAVVPNLYKKRDFHPRATLTPVILAAETPTVWVVSGKIEVNSASEFLAYAKANTGQLGFASVGIGTTPHLLGELFKTEAQIDLQHIPYKGSAPAMTDMIAGRVSMMFDQLGFVAPFVRSGQVKALAIVAPRRYAELPHTPTIGEVGFPLLAKTIWTAFAAPAGTPPEIVALLNREINSALQAADVRALLKQTGTFVVGGSVEHLREVWNSDENFWRDAVAKANVQLE
jgi:tripartite-type tricarboxylate transporter receptor subunit TctC